MNLPNRLTVGRLFLTMFFVAALGMRFPFHYTTALILFVVAGITDFVDGEIARRYGLVTDFGKLMDPLIDKVMTAAAFVSLVPLGAIPAWGRDCGHFARVPDYGTASAGRLEEPRAGGRSHRQAQDGLAIRDGDFLSGAVGEQRIRQPLAGVHWLRRNGTSCGSTEVLSISSVAVILTVYSGVDYFWRHRALLEME